MTDNVKIYADESIEVTPEMRSLIEKGLSSLKEWLEQRQKNGFFDGDAEAYEQTMQRAENAAVYFIGAGGKSVLEAIERGELHIVERKLKRFGKEKCLEDIEKMLTSPNAQGQVIRGYIEEPAIIINLKNYNRDKDFTLDSLVLHEGTHALNHYNSETIARQAVNFKVNDGVKYDMMYYDSGEEVYARLMQMRYHLKLDPSKQFSVEDITKLRQECLKVKDAKVDVARDFRALEQGKSYSLEEMKAIIKKSREQHAEEDANRLMNWFNYKAIFERYSDEQIMNLLNETAAVSPSHINEADRKMLRADMQRDFALADAKDRVSGLVAPVKINEKSSEEKTTKQTTVSTEMLINKLHETQYT